MSVTYQPKKKKRARTHGFLVRSKSAGGRQKHFNAAARRVATVSLF